MTSLYKNKKISIFLALGCMFTLAISSFSYFSDRISAPEVTFTAEQNGIIIEPSDPNVDPEKIPDDTGDGIEYIWNMKNPGNEEPMAPGDSFDLSYTLNNLSKFAIDVRETIVLTSTEKLDTTSPEFRIFLERAENLALGGFDGVPGKVVSVETIDKTGQLTIVYKIEPFILSGTEEKIVGAENVSKSLEYYFVFDRWATNLFQGDKATIDYLVEVKQHSKNGPSGGWTEAATVDLTLGGETLKVVPAK